MSEDKLAILGGSKTVTIEEGDMFAWPIVTKEHEEALLGVLRSGSMSGLKEIVCLCGWLRRKASALEPHNTFPSFFINSVILKGVIRNSG